MRQSENLIRKRNEFIQIAQVLMCICCIAPTLTNRLVRKALATLSLTYLFQKMHLLMIRFPGYKNIRPYENHAHNLPCS